MTTWTTFLIAASSDCCLSCHGCRKKKNTKLFLNNY
jgi:hypothetical protein